MASMLPSADTGGAEAASALEKLLKCKGAADHEGVARAARALATAGAEPELLQEAGTEVAGLLHTARDTNNKAAQGHLLVASAFVDLGREIPQTALKSAEEALEILKGLAQAKGIASALEAIFEAHRAQGRPHMGLREANKELEAARKAGDRPCEVAVLETIAHAHAVLGEPVSAISAARQAVEVHRSLGAKEEEGSALHTIAEMRWALGEHAEASEVARQALAAFKEAKCEWGQEQARGTISSILAARGKLEQAPNRQEALKALKELARAVEQKNSQDAKAAEGRLNKMRDLVTDYEIVEHLQPIMQKDPAAEEFLKDQGWNFGGDEGSGRMGGTYIKHYDQQAFYLHTIMTGMGFGPQFRAVHPYRKGVPGKDGVLALEVAQLPETEAWQMEMGYRPGIIDSVLQSGSVFGFP